MISCARITGVIRAHSALPLSVRRLRGAPPRRQADRYCVAARCLDRPMQKPKCRFEIVRHARRELIVPAGCSVLHLERISPAQPPGPKPRPPARAPRLQLARVPSARRRPKLPSGASPASPSPDMSSESIERHIRGRKHKLLQAKEYARTPRIKRRPVRIPLLEPPVSLVGRQQEHRYM